MCPLANEKQTIEAFVNELLEVCRKYPFKRICFYAILDKVSKDGTIDVLQEMGKRIPEIKVIYAPENRNVVDAYKRGYKEAIYDNVDWILEIDGGYSHQPSQIPQFFETMLEGKYDCVFLSRFCQKGRFTNGSFKRLTLSLGGTWVINLVLGTKLSDMTSGFELFTRDALVKILQKGILSKGPFFQSEIRAFAHQFRIIEVPIDYNAATGHEQANAIFDAFISLKRLVDMRLQGKLY